MNEALPGDKPQTRRLVTNAATRDLFRSKVRLVSSIVGAATAHDEDCKSSDESSPDVVQMVAQQPYTLPLPREQNEHATGATALELYARFSTNGEGIDRSHAVAALKSNGINERDSFFDVAFAKCDACGVGWLGEESFVRFCSIVQAAIVYRERKQRRQMSTGGQAKEAERRAATQALAGYVLP